MASRGQGSPLVGWCGPESSRNEAYLLTSPVLAAAARAGGCQVSVGANEADTAGGAEGGGDKLSAAGTEREERLPVDMRDVGCRDDMFSTHTVRGVNEISQ